MEQERQAEVMQENRPEKNRTSAKKGRSLGREALGLLGRTFFLLLTVYILFYHIVGITLMPNGDMYPRVDAGDMLLYYRLENRIKSQDIVVLQKPADTLPVEKTSVSNTVLGAVDRFDRKVKTLMGRNLPEEGAQTFVCRVVATAGDTVEISDSERLIVNGNAIIETNIFYSTPEYAGFVDYPLTLQEGEVFVLADNRQGGADSRFFGVVKREEILGTVITLLRRNNL